MLIALKKFYWDFADKSQRQLLFEHLLRNIPGHFGMHLRNELYGKLFAKAGEHMNILAGTYIIHPERVECGDHFKVGINNYIQAGGGLTCGDYVMLGPFAKIWTQNHIIRDINIPMQQQDYERKAVNIGNDVWIGASAFIMPGANIEDGCVVSAGAVVGGKRYKPRTILAGNPARKIGERKME